MNGDVCNKVGTYLKALAARDNGIPFYVAAPESSIDWALERGEDTPIEERDGGEVTHVWGEDEQGTFRRVRLAGPTIRAYNPAFDVTPAGLVSTLITERGACPASRDGLLGLFAERR
jgi:methylthioribose-1-phosphate isomerase